MGLLEIMLDHALDADHVYQELVCGRKTYAYSLLVYEHGAGFCKLLGKVNTGLYPSLGNTESVNTVLGKT